MFNISDYVEIDSPRSLPHEVVDYGVKMVGAPLEWPETQGEGIKVGIIDTGIDLNHEDLQGRVAEYYNFTSSESRNVFDDNGHGTHVAGIVAANRNGIGVVGVAHKSQLYIAKAFNKDGQANTKDIINALQWLLSKKVNVINMSFNTSEYVSDYNYLIKKAYSAGTLCVCSAGNEGHKSDTIEYPAKFPETVAVTAVDINKKVTDFSSGGPRADMAAPGKDILSTYPNNKYITLSGTSMAAPLITGSVALLQSKAQIRFRRYLSPSEIKLIMDMYADDLGHRGKDNEYGYGVFSFGRFNDVESLNTQNSRPSSRSNKPIYQQPQSASIQQGQFRTPNSYWGIFNGTLLLKMMGFRF